MGEPPADAPPLYWSLHGEVACEAHAPARTDPRWQDERWDRVPPGVTYQCEHCYPIRPPGLPIPSDVERCPTCGLSTLRTGETRVVRAPGEPRSWDWQVEYTCPSNHRRWVFAGIQIDDPE